MTHREVIKRIVLIIICAAVIPHASGQLTHWELRGLEDGTYPYVLPPLPYGFDALEPHIDTRELATHCTNYHASCVMRLNKGIAQGSPFYSNWAMKAHAEGLKDPTGRWLEEMVKDSNSVPETIRGVVKTNAGGHYNHSHSGK